MTVARREFIDKIRELIQSGQTGTVDLVGFSPRGATALLVCDQCKCMVPSDGAVEHANWHLAEAIEVSEWSVVEPPRDPVTTLPPLDDPPPPTPWDLLKPLREGT